VNRTLFFICFFLSSPLLRADIEPSLSDLTTDYYLTEVDGAGSVQLLKGGQAQWAQAKKGERLEEGDRIRVGEDTEVILTLKTDTLVHLDEGTEIAVDQLQDNPSGGFLSRLKLFAGAVLCDVQKHLEQTGSSFEVESGGVVCGVRGTSFEVAKNGNQVQTSTSEGVVEVKSPQGTQQVKAGQTCSNFPGHSPSLRPSSPQTQARFKAWRGIREGLRHPRSRPKPGGNRLGPNAATGHVASHPAGAHPPPPAHGGR
jgi:hypothetical protein